MERKYLDLLTIPTSEFYQIDRATELHTNTKPVKVFIIDKWYNVNRWSQILQITLVNMIEKHGYNPIIYKIKTSSYKKDFYNPVKLTEGNYPAKIHVTRCKKIMNLYGYDFETRWKLETIIAQKHRFNDEML